MFIWIGTCIPHFNWSSKFDQILRAKIDPVRLYMVKIKTRS